MKRTISILALAAPLATVALSLGATPAMAEPAGPEDLTLPIHGDPEPRPEIDDKAPPPNEPDEPNVPDDKAGLPQCPTHGDCGDDPDDEKDPGDDDGDDGEKDPDDGDDFKKPNRIDAGTGATDEGMQLTWLIAGAGLITATGAAYAVRSRARTRA
jgi:hypothetical protein